MIPVCPQCWFTSRLHVCTSFSHECSPSSQTGPGHRSAPSGKDSHRCDRVLSLTQLPSSQSCLQCYRKEAALHTKVDFNNKVRTACQEQRTGTVGRVHEPDVSLCGVLQVAPTDLLLLVFVLFLADLKSQRSLWWVIWLWGKPA